MSGVGSEGRGYSRILFRVESTAVRDYSGQRLLRVETPVKGWPEATPNSPRNISQLYCLSSNFA